MKCQYSVLTLLILFSLPSVSGNAQAFSEQSEPSPISQSGLTSLRVTEVHAPAEESSGEPNLTIASDGRVFLTWIHGTASKHHALSFASLDSAGWSKPRRIASGDNWFVNWADVPALAVNQYGRMMAAWLQKSGGGTYAYGVRASLSNDAGASWGEPFWLHHDSTDAEHGFVSLVPGANGSFDAIWLDGRETAHDGPMTLRHARIDRDGKFAGEYVVDSRVCDCCQTSAVRAGDGSLLAVYRDRSDDEVRDISISRFDGESWSAPRTIHADNWKILGCPVNGPAIDAAGSIVAVAWYTGADSVAPAVYFALSRDFGQTFPTVTRVDEGDPLGRVDVVVTDSATVFVSWMEKRADTGFVMMQCAGSGVPEMPPVRIAATSIKRESGFPRLVYDGKIFYMAWTDPQKNRVRTAFILPE